MPDISKISLGGLPAYIIRIAAVWPLALLTVSASDLYNDVHFLDIFSILPHGQIFLEGLKIMARTIPVLLVWNILIWVPTAFAKDLKLFIIGLGDLIFSAAILVAVVFQSMYLPHTYSSCQGADNWHNASDNTSLNFFQVASSLNNTDVGCTPQDVCSSYLENWAMGLAIFILYMLCAIFNIGFGCLPGCQASFRGHSNRISQPVFRLTSRPVYKFRYFLKYLRKDEVGNTNELDFLPGKLPGSERKSSLPIVLSTGSYNQQGGILAHYDVLMLVIRNLHYVDLFNLGLASKSLRQILFPTSDLATRSVVLQIYTCSEGIKSQCWVCDTQICSPCSTTRSILETVYSLHLANCQPYCSDCYRIVVCRTGGFRHSAQCNLKPRSRKNIDRAGSHHDKRMICRFCAEKSSEELYSRREARDRLAIARLSQRSLACAKCKSSLPVRGPRWWVCLYCDSECRDRIHPGWAQQTEV